MDTHDEVTPEEKTTYWGHHRLLLLIVLSIIIALVLVTISMALYNSSGAAQLDLSRPGVKAVTSQVVKSDGDFQDYSASGALDANAINEFRTIYDKQATKAKAVDAFSGDPLEPDALGIGVQETAQ